MVFQQFNLFPHMTVTENITLDRSRLAPSRRRARRRWSCSSAWASRTRPTNIPADLSGGQQQRVAIARALAVGRS